MAEKENQWKNKYYDSLDDLERREKGWKVLENLFKQAISRLTLAAEGNSQNLDIGLKQLRTAIRNGKSNRIIESILENVSKEIILLDNQAKSGPTGDAGFLVKIISQLQLAGKAEKKSRWLLKKLHAKNPPEQKELLKYFTELLSEVVKQALIEKEAKKNTNGGFLKNLFSGGNGKESSTEKEPSAEKEPSTEAESPTEESLAKEESSVEEAELSSVEETELSTIEEPETNATNNEALSENLISSEGTDSKKTRTKENKSNTATCEVSNQGNEKRSELALNEEQMTSVVTTVQNIMESIIDGMDISDEVKEKLKDKVFDVKPSKEVHVLLDDLRGILEGAGVIELPSDGDSSGKKHRVEHHDLLIRLIEFLPLEESVKEKAEQLKENFSLGVSTEQLPQALKSIAALISRMRNIVQQEQKEFELFLKNLTGRLKEVDEYLQKNFQEHRQSYQSGVDLDKAVKEQVRGIGDSVASIINLEEMETSIQTHLDKIVSHIDLHRTREDERVARVKAQNTQLSEKLKQMESKSNQLRQQVLDSQSKAMIDPLTQLPNRLAYDQRLKQEYARWKRYNSTLLVMVWDIDFFKQVNDNYGHQAGDKVLKVVASLLQKNLRETDFVSRFGGEEFVSLMPETTLGGGFKVADKIRATIESLEFHYHGDNVKVTISCGISLFMENDTPDTAFARADKALYEAKDQGRNRCVIAKEP